jgi:hypothetical protein
VLIDMHRQGNMPPQIKFLHPNANISTTHHERPGYENATKGDCAWVASTDPLFGAVADMWMQTMIADFGTDHWYYHAPATYVCVCVCVFVFR